MPQEHSRILQSEAPGRWEYQEIPWDGDLQSIVVEAWRYLLARIPQATVFQYPEWVSLACQFGVMRPKWVLILICDGRPACLMPFYRRTPLAVEVMAPMAPEHPPVLFDPALERDALTALASWLQVTSRANMVYLGRHGEARTTLLAQQMNAVAM